MSPSTVKARTIIAHVEDKPGVLNRIASLFRRRAFNISSLTVGRSAVSGISRVTLVIDADDDMAKRVEANLYKLVNVLHVEDVTFGQVVARDLALIKVRASADRRAEVLKAVDVFQARVVDLGTELMTIEITDTPEKIDGLVAVLRPYPIVEMVRTGVVAMTRGEPHAQLFSATKTEEQTWHGSSTNATRISG